MQPAEVLAADLTGEPAAELLAEVGHRGPAQRTSLLHAHPANLQALDLAGAPTLHHRQQRHLGADPEVSPALLWPGTQLAGQVRQEHQVSRRPVRMAGQQPVQHLAVRLRDLLGQQGGRGDHQHAAGLGCDLGERLIQQDDQVAVSHPAGPELLTIGVRAKPHLVLP